MCHDEKAHWLRAFYIHKASFVVVVVFGTPKTFTTSARYLQISY